MSMNKTPRTRKIRKHRSLEDKLKAIAKKNAKKGLRKKVYPKEKCHFVSKDAKGNTIRCNRYAVGKGQLCKQHGGDPRIRDNYLVSLDSEETKATTTQDTKMGIQEKDAYSIVKSLKGKKSIFNPKVHPTEFLKLSASGLSEVEIAAEFKVPVNRIQKWAEDYELFSEAYDVGKAMYESWWLRKGKDGLDDPRNFNTTLFKFLTGNKLGYSEKMESKNFNVNAGVLVVPKTQSIEEWEAAGTSGAAGSSNSSFSEDDIIDAEAEEIKR